mgnify:CR=1 FL=1
MRSILPALAAALAVALAALPATGQDAPVPGVSGAPALSETAAGAVLALSLRRAVPWRAFTLDAPPRLVVDLATSQGVALPALPGRRRHVSDLRAGAFGPDWTRIVADLALPLVIAEAGMTTGAEGATVSVALHSADPAAFTARSGAPPPSAAFPEDPVPRQPAPRPRRAGDRPTIVLDPGHGGVDPGAVRDGHHEADIALAFARALRDELRRDGRFRVAMTRDADVFVSLEGRIAAARRAGADLFVSIHADAVAEGIARGAQVWTLSEEASSRAGRLLAERHNRADLLAGLDLSGQDDRIAQVLMDIARTETAPRTEALAETLVAGLREAGIRLHRRPRESAAFAVLKAPDIPSVLVELGFMSSPGELEKLLSPEWRALAAAAMARALADWAEADAARAALLRR